MAGSRIDLVKPSIPAAGRLLVMGARAADDLTVFDPERTVIVQGHKPDHDALAARGYTLVPTLTDLAKTDRTFSAGLVMLPRAKDLARARIAAAAAVLDAGAPLWIDGQKTDGIDSILKESRALAAVEDVQPRAHGKIFRVAADGAAWVPGDWAATDQTVDGFVTRAGVFSADGIDPASAMLAAHLPAKLPTRVVDLGAGWGWLSAQVLTRPGVEALHLVEADADALACAQANIHDPRAHFHWADGTTFRLPDPVNGVVMNPPFHDGRAADPQLGARFIRAAASMLTGAGRLWMVANRHLPYEAALAEHFADVAEIGGDGRFKVISATGARRPVGRTPNSRRR